MTIEEAEEFHTETIELFFKTNVDALFFGPLTHSMEAIAFQNVAMVKTIKHYID